MVEETSKADSPSEAKPQETVKPDLSTAIVEGTKLVERQEAANKETAKLQARQDEMDARKLLGGKTAAGESGIVSTEAEKKVKGAAEFFKGTALGDDITKANE